MWDTPGLDYEKTQEFILNEIKRIVADGIERGPDHYINIILYCVKGERFHNQEGQLINEIMKIYPFDNLPVIITQMQSYFIDKAQIMEKSIQTVLDKYLDHEIVQKIEIKSILARDYIDNHSNIRYKAYGIPELLRLSFDIMGRSISSATCKGIITDIEKLCKDFMEKKREYAQNLFKYEMEILEVAKSLFIDDSEDDNIYLGDKKKKQIKELSSFNIYRNIENTNYFVDNFCQSMSDKFIDIFNNLENGNMPFEGENEQQENNVEENEIEENNNEQNNINENIQQENNVEENEIEENNNEQNNINENIQQENIQNENNQQEEKEEENGDQKNENQKENAEEGKDVKDKPEVELLIQERLEKLRKRLDEASNKTFEKIFEKRSRIYLSKLQREQSDINKEFNDNSQIIDSVEVEKNFKEKLSPYFKNEFFKIFFCIILKLFMNNLNDIFEMNIQKEITKNENVQKTIRQKAEISLKNITENLKKNLISELDDFMREKREENNENKKENEFDNEDVDFAF